jgi:hypothetical protein
VTAPASVVPAAALAPGSLEALLQPYGLILDWTGSGPIAGSYWGESEAGLVGNRLVLREDTPVHSALHEACHWICAKSRDAHDISSRMHAESRVRPYFSLHTDAGGDDLEECAVCYLQCLLADALPGYSRARMFADMDAWGYSFRLGSAQAWFQRDAADARAWLAARALLPE